MEINIKCNFQKRLRTLCRIYLFGKESFKVLLKPPVVRELYMLNILYLLCPLFYFTQCQKWSRKTRHSEYHPKDKKTAVPTGEVMIATFSFPTS